MRIAGDVTALIGGTPLVALDRFAAARGLGARLLAKVEAANPGGSAKDRVALAVYSDYTAARQKAQLPEHRAAVEDLRGV